MRELLLATAVLLAGCATPGAGPGGGAGPSALESAVARLDARMIGLTEELDRLAHRVRALEDRRPSEPPAAEPPTTEPETPAPAAAMTGIVLDLRAADGFPAGRSFAAFRVVDPDGAELFGKEDVDAEIRAARPFFYTAPAGTDLGANLEPLLGARRVTIDAASARVEKREDGTESAAVTIDAASSEDLRSRENLAAVVAAGNVVFLVRPAE